MQLEYFRMIDKVAAFDAGKKSILCEARVPKKSTIFEGHFPGHPLMPGVLLLETMAQASGYLILKLTEFGRMPFFVAADRVKLRQFVLPEDLLNVDVQLQHQGSGFAVTVANISRGEEKICEAELKFKLIPFINDELKQATEAQMRRVGLLP
jgi:3-hydroxyacyl-[acyl-carrier-protein] dehydratase